MFYDLKAFDISLLYKLLGPKMSFIKATQTLIYKTIGKLEIKLDLYLPKDPVKVPVLIWFHGGGLL